MPRRYLKCAVGETIAITVKDIKPQRILNISGEGEVFHTIFDKALQARLGELWKADRANPKGPLVGKTLTITRSAPGMWELKVGKSQPAPDEELPFQDEDDEIPF